jgi:HK97 gp10 family phage protein
MPAQDGRIVELKMNVTVNLHIKEVEDKVKEATRLAMRDVVTDIANDAVNASPVLTGNNRRSIAFECEGVKGEIGVGEGEGAVYSTSGYGGWLEVGTKRMPARPYMKPALDRHYTQENMVKLIKEHL